MGELWTVAAIVGGFQLAALSFRLQRELTMEARGETTWLTLADGLVGMSLLLLVFGVFAAPVFGAADLHLSVRLFGLSLVMFVSSVFVLAGHYNLYCHWGRNPSGERERITPQEKVAFGFAAAMMVAYGIWWAAS